MLISGYGLLKDLNADDSLRMKNSTVKYVTMLDLGEIVFTVFIGIVTTPFKLKYFWNFLNSINKVDTVLQPKKIQAEKKSIIKCIVFAKCWVLLVFTYEFFLWNTIAVKLGLDWIFFQRYLFVFITYFVIFVQEVPYWVCVRLIRKRIESLNFYLMLYLNSKTANLKFGMIKNTLTYESITTFMSVYDTICDGIDAANDFCGVNVLVRYSKKIFKTFFFVLYTKRYY